MQVDIYVYLENKYLSVLTETLNQELIHLTKWIKTDSLMLNISEIHYLISHF